MNSIPSWLRRVVRGPAAPARPVRRPDLPTAARRHDFGDRPVLDVVVAYNRYGGYVVPTAAAHRIAARRVLNGHVYEPRTIELIAERCGDGDVVHAGTFFGDFLPALSTALAPGARVHAFEPHPDSFRCASMTLLLNGIENVSLTHAGLGAEPGVAELATNRADGRTMGGASRLVDEQSGFRGRRTEVRVTTVDDEVPQDRTVTVLQLDVEGHEQQALTGALAVIRRCRPLLVLETLPEPAWIAEHLTPLGYRALPDKVHLNTVLVCD